jgi:hypothetical protein
VTRTFIHGFDPLSASPVAGSTVDLDLSKIEDGGITASIQYRATLARTTEKAAL